MVSINWHSSTSKSCFWSLIITWYYSVNSHCLTTVHHIFSHFSHSTHISHSRESLFFLLSSSLNVYFFPDHKVHDVVNDNFCLQKLLLSPTNLSARKDYIDNTIFNPVYLLNISLWWHLQSSYVQCDLKTSYVQTSQFNSFWVKMMFSIQRGTIR